MTEPPLRPTEQPPEPGTTLPSSTSPLDTPPLDTPPLEPPPGADLTEERGPDPLRSSRTGRAWVSVVALGVVLVLLIIFIAQNTHRVTVSFLGWQGETPLAVALLIATVAGLLLAAIAGTLRIWQLRRRVKREAKRAR
ncbi:LapA family protein [Nocardioides sp. Iso805N]|uniref:LapA family protein n=1 Tax=Nocardioides sp. Iso805N TaxID=1283287 RepID=UPI00037FB2D2|nr:LapA family protein [Nocardioides sp. Iso805N]